MPLVVCRRRRRRRRRRRCRTPRSSYSYLKRRGRDGSARRSQTVLAHACRQRERRGRVWVACGGGAPKSASFNDDTLPFVSAHSIPVNLLGERMCTVRLVRFHELHLFRPRRHARPAIIKMDGRSRRAARRTRWRLCGRCFQRFLLVALLRLALRGRLCLGHLRGIEEDSRCWIYQFTWFQDISNSDCGPSTHLAIGAADAVATCWRAAAHPEVTSYSTNLLTDRITENRYI